MSADTLISVIAIGVYLTFGHRYMRWWTYCILWVVLGALLATTDSQLERWFITALFVAMACLQQYEDHLRDGKP